MNPRRLNVALVLVALALTSCSQPSQPGGETKTSAPASQAAAPAQQVSGKKALWEAYKSAHGWAKDLAPLAVTSKSVPGIKNEGGNAAMWAVTFGSPSKHEARIFTYSVASHAPDIYKGVTIGNPIPWSGPTSAALPFATSDDELVLDSDAAYKTASEQATRWLKQHPDQELTISLGNSSRFPGAVWYLQWGDKKSGYAAYVNAKTGAIVK
jgi:hypothetical protein